MNYLATRIQFMSETDCYFWFLAQPKIEHEDIHSVQHFTHLSFYPKIKVYELIPGTNYASQLSAISIICNSQKTGYSEQQRNVGMCVCACVREREENITINCTVCVYYIEGPPCVALRQVFLLCCWTTGAQWHRNITLILIFFQVG